MSNIEYVQIKDLKMGMKNINAVFIVLEVGPPTLTKEAREVRSLRVADATGAVNLSVWDEAGALLQPGDIVRLVRGYASLWRNTLTLYSGKSGDIQKIDEFCMLFNEQVNMSEQQPPSALAGGGPAPGAAPPGARGASVPAAPASVPAAPGPGPPPAAAPSAPQAPPKHAHKTYVRGRGHHRGAARR